MTSTAVRAPHGYRQKLIIGPVVAVALLLASAFSCSSEEPPGSDTPERGQMPQAGPRELSGVELVRPTGLRLLAPPYVVDIDADTVTELEVDADAFTASERAAPPGEAVLLDPDSLAELARYPAVAVVDSHRVITFGNRHRGGAVRLLDLRTGEAALLDRPDLDAHFDVRGVSPDGPWLAVVFVTMSRMPTTVDVWMLDLISLEWQRLPSMPALGSPMSGAVAGWAPDGRLVLVGQFNQDAGFVTQLAIWRVGDAELSLMEYPYPLGRRGVALIM